MNEWLEPVTDEEWDKYIRQLDSMGLQDFLKIQKDAYDTYNKNK